MASLEQQKNFVTRFFPFAKEIEKRDKIPALFSLAQAALESGWNTTPPGNMLFGVTAGPSYTGKKQLLQTFEYFPDNNRAAHPFPEVISITPLPNGLYLWKVKRYFRAYDSPLGSFEDHARLLKNDRYKKAFTTTDPKQWAREVARAGYATAPDYADRLIMVQDKIKALLNGTAAPTAPSQVQANKETESGLPIAPILLILIFSILK